MSHAPARTAFVSRFLRLALVVAGLALSACSSVDGLMTSLGLGDPWSGAERRAGRIAAIARPLNEEAWFVPGGPDPIGGSALLKARVYRPDGPGPFRVAILNHGAPPEMQRRNMPVPDFRAAANWFVARGYMVVVPQRRGYGDGPSGGAVSWPESYGACAAPDYVRAGLAAADDVEAVARYVRTLPLVRRDRILLVGHGDGGFAVAAATAANPQGVFGAVALAPGRRGMGGGGVTDGALCVPNQMVAAMETFGATAKVPTLWLASENDRLFSAALGNALVSAYGDSGGRAVYILLPPYKEDGHLIFPSDDGVPYWSPYVTSFLEALE
jgi:dienelactone hydrolase